MPDNLTRKDLYNLVWSKPMVEIAKEYGFSDRGLAKLCERHNIPVPYRGYWAKKQAGKKVSKAPFLALENKVSETEILLKKTVFVKSSVKEKTEEDKLSIPESIQQAINQERLPQNKIRVLQKLRNPHHIVKKWVKHEEDERLFDKKYARFNWREPITALDRRKWRLCSALFTSLEERGFKVFESTERGYPKQLLIGFEQDHILYDMYEHIRQYRRELTEEEKKDHPYTKQKWTQEREKTGKLKITLNPGNTAYSSITICEDDNKILEDSLNEVVIKIIETLWSVKKERLAQQEREHQRWKEAKRQQAIRDTAEKEEKRKNNLIYKAYTWKQAQNIREYVAAVDISKLSGALKVEDKSYAAWKNWSLNYADKIDFITNGNPLIDLENEPEKLGINYDFEGSTPYPSGHSYSNSEYPWKKWYHR